MIYETYAKSARSEEPFPRPLDGDTFLAYPLVENGVLEHGPANNAVLYRCVKVLLKAFPNLGSDQTDMLLVGQSVLYFCPDGSIKEIVTENTYFAMHPKPNVIYAFDSELKVLNILVCSG